jgi:hypothetical protein
MSDCQNDDRALVFLIEEDPIIAAPKTKTGERRFQFFYITRAGTQVAIETMQD